MFSCIRTTSFTHAIIVFTVLTTLVTSTATATLALAPPPPPPPHQDQVLLDIAVDGSASKSQQQQHHYHHGGGPPQQEGDQQVNTQTTTQQTNVQGCALLMEPRPLTTIVPVLLNVHRHIPQTWVIIIYHGKHNQHLLTQSPDIVSLCRTGRLMLRSLPRKEFTILDYNELFGDPDFWATLPADRVLRFELDTVLCENPTKSLQSFFRFDFIGAPWKMRGDCGKGKFLPVCCCNSGLSMWSRDAMVRTLALPSFQAATLHRRFRNRNNDMQLSSMLQKTANERHEARIPAFHYAPTEEEAQFFSVETRYDGTFTPVGVHKPWQYLSTTMMRELVYRCPAIRLIWMPQPEY